VGQTIGVCGLPYTVPAAHRSKTSAAVYRNGRDMTASLGASSDMRIQAVRDI
jgi:hypothetical protein